MSACLSFLQSSSSLDRVPGPKPCKNMASHTPENGPHLLYKSSTSLTWVIKKWRLWSWEEVEMWWISEKLGGVRCEYNQNSEYACVTFSKNKIHILKGRTINEEYILKLLWDSTSSQLKWLSPIYLTINVEKDVGETLTHWYWEYKLQYNHYGNQFRVSLKN